ncbi:universal stress protein [Roseiconus nitratireducens]|uniref:Universal stress protein n=1 Tax=Roseiconus nitratireducens TaxID=2605748 RepID=A0A5M6D860_9BACT|nr:universal stress protein [Roseiconus nitratireducens]KAA5543734.1 universal stress protein [Roseiconus nitratireducens]
MQCFNNILVYVGTEDPRNALKRAFALAKDSDARVTLMDVIKPLPRAVGMLTKIASAEELGGLLVKEREEKLRQTAEQYADQTVKCDVIVAVGDPARKIVSRVLQADHDLVLKSADGSAGSGRSFSSVARSLLRICPCPVWILKPEIHDGFDQVLAAIDVDAEDATHRQLNDRILELAKAVSERDKATLHIVCAWELWMEHALRRRAGDAEVDQAVQQHEAVVRRDLDKLLAPLQADGDSVQIHLHRGLASQVIRGVAEQVQADLLVMGTVCRTGVAGFLIGNTAENLLGDVTCSVLAIKPEGFVSPVADSG